MKKLLFLFGIALFLTSCFPHNYLTKQIREDGGEVFRTVEAERYEIACAEENVIIQEIEETFTVFYFYEINNTERIRILRNPDETDRTPDIPIRVDLEVTGLRMEDDGEMLVRLHDNENDIEYVLATMRWASRRGWFYILSRPDLDYNIVFLVRNTKVRNH